MPVKQQKHLHQLIAFVIIFVAGGGNFPPSFPDCFFFFHLDGIFFGRHLRHLFVIRFIKSTFTTMFTITGITSIVITLIYCQFQEWTMMTKGNLFMSLKGNFRCQFVYTLHGVLAKIILTQFVLKMAHLSILMEPTLLLEKASATVSYNAFG